MQSHQRVLGWPCPGRTSLSNLAKEDFSLTPRAPSCQLRYLMDRRSCPKHQDSHLSLEHTEWGCMLARHRHPIILAMSMKARQQEDTENKKHGLATPPITHKRMITACSNMIRAKGKMSELAERRGTKKLANVRNQRSKSCHQSSAKRLIRSRCRICHQWSRSVRGKLS